MTLEEWRPGAGPRKAFCRAATQATCDYELGKLLCRSLGWEQVTDYKWQEP